MDRRVLIGILALGTLAVPCVTPAQSARKVYRIGILTLRATSELVGPQPQSPSIKALLRALRELRYIYGEHFVTEARGGGGRPERFPSLAAELVRLRVDVILAAGPALPALKQATSTVPVIMTATLDPCAPGLRPEPRTPRRQLHRLQPSVARDDREATRAAQRARPGYSTGSGALRPIQYPGLAGGRSRRPGAAVEAAVA